MYLLKGLLRERAMTIDFCVLPNSFDKFITVDKRGASFFNFGINEREIDTFNSVA